MRFIALLLSWVFDGSTGYNHLLEVEAIDAPKSSVIVMRLSAIKGCIPVDTAMYDIPSQLKNAGPLRTGMYTAAFGQNEADQRSLSPNTHVAQGKSIPPFLILHVADRPDAASQSRAFAKALADAGVPAKVVPGQGKTHATINRDLGLPDDEPTKVVFAFLDGLLADR